ncbi:hypothetical protein [Mycoplasma capricolum]|uniref:hypothetical protein n=1 Tax=Mycoplasma capricolum TaxID=2095 RepID=UPI003DA4A39D
MENCSNFINGLTGITKNNFSYGKDLYIDYLNVFNNIFVDQKLLKTYNNTKNQNYIRYKDVLLTVSSETPEEVAMSSLISWKPNKNIAFNSFCICIRFANKEQFDAKYLGYLFRSKSFRKQAEKMAQGISRFNINQTILKKAKIYYPLKIEEQEKIGKSFYTLDSLITLHQWECNFWKFRNFVFDFLKFSTRFFKKIQKYTHTWEQWKAKNLFIPFREKNILNNNLISYSVSNRDGFINQREYFDDGGKAVYASKKNSLIIDFNTFAYNPSRINVGSLCLYKNKEKGLVSPIYEVFKLRNDQNPDFFYLWFKTGIFKKIIANNSNKSVRDTLNLKQFEDYI